MRVTWTTIRRKSGHMIIYTLQEPRPMCAVKNQIGITWTITSASLLAVPSSLSCSSIKACKGSFAACFDQRLCCWVKDLKLVKIKVSVEVARDCTQNSADAEQKIWQKTLEDLNLRSPCSDGSIIMLPSSFILIARTDDHRYCALDVM